MNNQKLSALFSTDTDEQTTVPEITSNVMETIGLLNLVLDLTNHFLLIPLKLINDLVMDAQGGDTNED